MTPPKPLSLAEVCRLFDITPPTLRSWVQAGRFPPPLNIGKRKKKWSADVVERLLLGQLNENGEKAKARRH